MHIRFKKNHLIVLLIVFMLSNAGVCTKITEKTGSCLFGNCVRLLGLLLGAGASTEVTNDTSSFTEDATNVTIESISGSIAQSMARSVKELKDIPRMPADEGLQRTATPPSSSFALRERGRIQREFLNSPYLIRSPKLRSSVPYPLSRISKQTFANVMKRNSKGYTGDYIEKIFEKYDLDKSGDISYGEAALEKTNCESKPSFLQLLGPSTFEKLASMKDPQKLNFIRLIDIPPIFANIGTRADVTINSTSIEALMDSAVKFRQQFFSFPAKNKALINRVVETHIFIFKEIPGAEHTEDLREYLLGLSNDVVCPFLKTGTITEDMKVLETMKERMTILLESMLDLEQMVSKKRTLVRQGDLVDFLQLREVANKTWNKIHTVVKAVTDQSGKILSYLESKYKKRYEKQRSPSKKAKSKAILEIIRGQKVAHSRLLDYTDTAKKNEERGLYV